MRLHVRYAIALGVLLAGVIALLTAVLVQVSDRAMTRATRASAGIYAATLVDQMEERALELAHLLGVTLVDALDRGDLVRIETRVTEFLDRPDVVYAGVFAANGQRLGGRLPDADGPRADRSPHIFAAPNIIRHDDVLDIRYPVMFGGQYIGGLRVGLSLTGAERRTTHLQARLENIARESRYDQYLWIAALGVPMLLLVMPLAAFSAARMTGAIRTLAATARRIGEGDYHVPVPVSPERLDEVGELAEAFRSMQVSLKRTTVSKRYLDDIIGSMGELLLVVNADGTIRMANNAALTLLGITPESLIGKPLHDLIVADDSNHHEALTFGLSDRPVDALECRLFANDRSTVPVAISSAPLRRNGVNDGAVVVARDVSERQEKEKSQRLVANIFDSAAEAFVVVERNGTVVRINPAFTEMTGYTEQDVVGTNALELRPEQQSAEFYRDLWTDLFTVGRWRGEMRSARKDGRPYVAWVSITALRDRAGTTDHYVGVISDVTGLRQAEEQVRFHANFDPLTELPNRRLFRDRLEQAILHQDRHGKHIALLFLDLDGFKFVNDSLGHDQGDELLKQIAALLRKAVRDSDTVARLGGDEFTVMLEVNDADEAAVVAQKIITELSRPYDLDGHRIFVTASIGIAVFPEDARTAEDLIRHADAAMYHAKAKGKQNYQFYTEELNVRTMERLSLESDLRRAVEQEQFIVHYQPRVDARTLRMTGMEALVRWRHPERGLIQPGDFIGLAEETGMIMSIGEQVLRQACRQACTWRRAGYSLRIAVNLSARQFLDAYLVQRVEEVLIESGLSANDLELEITESAAMEYPEEAIVKLKQLADMGIHLAIDDFGTGHSSLNYLKRFPLHVLKIDRTFVRDIADDPDDASIVSATIGLAHELGLRVVAEGVEDEQQSRFLRQRGCDEFQGFLYGRPEPADVVGARLANEQPEQGPEQGSAEP